MGGGILSLPDFTRNREASLSQAVSSGDLPRRRKYMQLLLEHFWKRWSREYVTELRNLHRHKSRPKRSISISVEDVVTLFEDNLPRSHWRLGRVEQLIPSTDDDVNSSSEDHHQDWKTWDSEETYPEAVSLGSTRWRD